MLHFFLVNNTMKIVLVNREAIVFFLLLKKKPVSLVIALFTAACAARPAGMNCPGHYFV